MNRITIVSHFHKNFYFNDKCEWIIPTCSEDSPLKYDKQFTNISDKVLFSELQNYYSKQTSDQFYKALGTEASIYWLLNNYNYFKSDYLGFSSYRRFLHILDNQSSEDRISIEASKNNIDKYTSPVVYEKIIKIFDTFDVILCKARKVDYDMCVEDQYLKYESREHWNLFKEGITTLYPKYLDKIDWFRNSKYCSFETPIIMKKDYFIEMTTEFFNILKYVWSRCSEVFPDKSIMHWDSVGETPWRYPGFLGERFFPFYVNVNNISKYEVPLLFFI